MNQQPTNPEHIIGTTSTQKTVRTVLTAIIVVMVVIVGYLSYAFIARSSQQHQDLASASKIQKVIQLDLLNGCGEKGIASKLTTYLRKNGFDVVEMKNYKTSNIPQTIVIDRVGDLNSARQVAAALGVSEKNIIQQLNPDYFVDVSVVIGKDFGTLHISQ